MIEDDEDNPRRTHLFPEGDSPDGGRLLIYLVLVVIAGLLVWGLIL